MKYRNPTFNGGKKLRTFAHVLRLSQVLRYLSIVLSYLTKKSVWICFCHVSDIFKLFTVPPKRHFPSHGFQ